jgi:hypothetical protein
MGKLTRKKTVETFPLELFPGLSACMDSFARDLEDAYTRCKEQLDKDGRIPILDVASGKVVHSSVRAAILRSCDAPGDAAVAAANEIITGYREAIGAGAICCVDKMLSVARCTRTVSVHTLVPQLAGIVRERLVEGWNPTSVLQFLSIGGILPPALSPDDYDAEAYAENQIRRPVLSRLDSHVQRSLNNAVIQQAKVTAEPRQGASVASSVAQRPRKQSSPQLPDQPDERWRTLVAFAAIKAGKKGLEYRQYMTDHKVLIPIRLWNKTCTKQYVEVSKSNTTCLRLITQEKNRFARRLHQFEKANPNELARLLSQTGLSSLP